MYQMNNPENWKKREAVVDYLARQLLRGRLALFLGAGVSNFFGLPDWVGLVNALCAKNNCEHADPGSDLTVKVEAIRSRYYADKNSEFLDDVASALYEGQELDFLKIRSNDLLSAIGSLVMASKRGSAATVISLNYDDLLELYLEYHGFVVDPIWNDRHWAGTPDVRIYHPHGFLPLDPSRKRSDEIVLGMRDYQRIMSDSSLWKPMLQTLLRTHSFLFIGLSGEDRHLQTLIGGTENSHANVQERSAFHSVRFELSEGSDIAHVLETFGVSTQVVSGYDELPDFLFEICQQARQLRGRSDS